MFKFFSQLFGDPTQSASLPTPSSEQPVAIPAALVEAPGVAPLDVPAHMPEVDGFPLPDWDAIMQWIDSVPSESEQASAWARCELVWLQRLQSTLGPGYVVRTADDVALLSSLDDSAARATLAQVSRSRQRVMHTLKGIAELPGWGFDILVVLNDEDTYYRYVSSQFPDEGEFAFSSGMYLNGGCGHFVLVKDELLAMEPTIVHELTHSCLSHLPIPLWLNEGLAVNTEQRFYPRTIGSHRGGYDAQGQHRRHQAFWGAPEIQAFWSGDSYARTDEGNALSYDLGRILTTQFAADWTRFTAFAHAANWEDGGAQAAREHLGLSLGHAVCAVLELPYDEAYEPDAKLWRSDS